MMQLADDMERAVDPPASNARLAEKLERNVPILVALAENLYRSRRMRDDMFDGELFGEPAWDMLLDLYISHVGARRVPVTSLCHASCKPTSTALRWLAALESRGLASRYSSSSDNRVKYVELTELGVTQMNKYLWHLATSLPPTLPLQIAAARRFHVLGE